MEPVTFTEMHSIYISPLYQLLMVLQVTSPAAKAALAVPAMRALTGHTVFRL